MIDELASERVLRYGVPPCLRVPIAARDEAALTAHVGAIVAVLSRNATRRAFLIKTHPSPAIDTSLPIWDEPGSAMLYQPLQVWVDHNYTGYRRAFSRGLPAERLDRDVILSHAMNRRLAAIRGFQFVRLTPTSRRANSSSAFSEGWAITRHSVPRQVEANRKLGLAVQYADLTDLMLMMDMSLGGGVMDAVNQGQRLIRSR